MDERIALSQAVIVEGKYDKIRLESVVDALILTTDGFRIFRDKEMRALVRALADRCGIVVLTDSDAAGFRIRALLSGIAGKGKLTQVYIPDIFGKEKRKSRPGREGKIGVEGVDRALLREAFAKAGLLPAGTPPHLGDITRQDLYELGLTGGPGSSALRRALLLKLGLPQRLSTSAMLPVLNHITDRKALEAILERL